MSKKAVRTVVELVRHRDLITIASRKETTEELCRGIEELFIKLTPSEALLLAKKLGVLAKRMLRRSLLGR